MQSGESIPCPLCGETTIVKSRRRYDGFTVVGEEYFCMICNGALGPADQTAAGAATPTASRLAALLDTEIAAVPTLEDAPGVRHFCRDCKHFISHPFLSRCEFHHREVNPMDDCPDFERKKS